MGMRYALLPRLLFKQKYVISLPDIHFYILTLDHIKVQYILSVVLSQGYLFYYIRIESYYTDTSIFQAVW